MTRKLQFKITDLHALVTALCVNLAAGLTDRSLLLMTAPWAVLMVLLVRYGLVRRPLVFTVLSFSVGACIFIAALLLAAVLNGA